LIGMDKTTLPKTEKNKVLALIPARGGSKGVPDKNIRMLFGHPLIAYAIAAARMSRETDRIIVTTDSERIAAVAKSYGAEVPFLCPAKYARDDSPDIEFVRHAVEWLLENEGGMPDYIVHLRPTAPLRDPRVIDAAIAAVREDAGATSLRSGSLCAHPPYKWFKEGADGYWAPLFASLRNDDANIPRQEFPKVYVPNGYVDVLKTEFVMRSGLLHGERMIGFQTDEMPDIDTEEDLNRLSARPGLDGALAGLKAFLEETHEKRGNL
jgi:N-acylneuraminate cytidylyltransferase